MLVPVVCHVKAISIANVFRGGFINQGWANASSPIDAQTLIDHTRGR